MTFCRGSVCCRSGSSLLVRVLTDAEGWNAIFISEIARTRRMVEAGRATLPCYASTNSNTNTNAAQKAAWSARFPAVAIKFEYKYRACLCIGLSSRVDFDIA